MKKEMETPNVNKSSRKQDAQFVKKGTKLLFAIFSLLLRGGKIDVC